MPYLASIFKNHPLNRLTRPLSSLSGIFVYPDIDIHQVLALTLSILSLLLAYRLYQRVRWAWLTEMILTTALLVLYLTHSGVVWSLFSLVLIFILVTLGLTGRDFSRTTDRTSVTRAVLMALASLALILINSLLSLTFFHRNVTGIHNFLDAFNHSLKALFLMDATQSGFTSRIGLVYANSLILINWIFIIGAAIFILKPLIVNPITAAYDKRRALEFVEKYGKNPVSYLALEADKRYFFGLSVPGVIAYTISNGVFVICGDPICARDDVGTFLAELLNYVQKNALNILLINVTDEFAAVYRDLGFTLQKLGEDAVIELTDYELKGKKVARLRSAINHATKAGLTTHEYRPDSRRQPEIEQAFANISKNWQKDKGAELGFMIGSVNLAAPLGRRYFYTMDENEKILGFIVCLPYDNKKGYMIDITRRHADAENGTMEKLTYDALMLLRADGALYGNLGLCPLVNVSESDADSPFVSRLSHFIYENLNGVYDFKGLYQAKKKYAPTDWQARYIAYYPKTFSVKLLYALVKVQTPQGLFKLFRQR